MPTDTFTKGTGQTAQYPGLTSIFVELWGAQGENDGGLGGHVSGDYDGYDGAQLEVNVGGQDGTNGGGNGGTNADGGGGASDVRDGGTALADRAAVAGGGGGDGSSANGGDGGADTGQAGTDASGGEADGGEGGTQSAGGAGGDQTGGNSEYGCGGGDGSLGQGGNGCTARDDDNDPEEGGGGGGGGYYGGGGGAAYTGEFGIENQGAGGGGGSNYDDDLAGTPTNERGIRTGNGLVEITYQNTNPENLTDTAVGSGTIDLSWDAPSGSNVKTPSSYKVYRDTSPGVTTSDTLAGTPSGTTFQDSGLSAGTTYYYAVVPVFPNGDGDISGEHSASTLAKPTGLTVTQGAEDELDLSWDEEPSATEYRVYRATSSGSDFADYTQVATVSPGSTTTHTDTGLDDGTTYYYRITFFDGSTESGLSDEDSATTVLPGATNLAEDSTTSTSFTVTWTVNADTGTQRVEYKRSSDASWTTDASGLSLATASHQITGLLNGEEYDVRVGVETADAGPVYDS